jgi:hypothetical protein
LPRDGFLFLIASTRVPDSLAIRKREVEIMETKIATREQEVPDIVKGGERSAFELARHVEKEIAVGESHIAAYKDKIRAAELYIAKLKRFRRELGDVEGIEPESGDEGVSRAATDSSAPKAKRKRRYRAGSDAYIVVTVARKAIRDAGKPLDRTAIVNAIEAAGLKLKSQDPEHYINKVMWESGEFRNVGDGYDFSEPDGSDEP